MADDDVLTFDLKGWPPDMLEKLELMLERRSITFDWDPPGVLNVASWHEHEVDHFLDYLEGQPEGEPGSRGSGQQGAMGLDDFYEGDSRRRESEEVEFGRGWTDADGLRYDVCWVYETGELTLMKATSGPTIEVLATLTTLDEVEVLLGGWADAIAGPNSVQWVRDRAASAHPRASASHASHDDVADESWDIPAAIGWITTEMDLVFAAYETLRDTLDADQSLKHALVTALDRDSWERLTEFFDGKMDVVYGDGAGERARIAVRDALEERTTPDPGDEHHTQAT